MNRSCDRRRFLGTALGAIGAVTLWPRLTFAATGSDARLLVVMLRGGLDGLHAVPPYGDSGYLAARGALALSPTGAAQANAKPAHKLDGTFALHPALDYAAQLYAQRQFMPLVAVAPPYWGRSHFDAQDCVENGTAAPHGAQTGWLNRAVAAIPGAQGLAIATVMPLTMRGAGKVGTWSPPLPEQIDPILLQRLQPLYAADTRLAPSFARAIEQQRDAPMVASMTGKDGRKGNGRLALLMGAAGGFMAKADGARVGFVEDDGWDTHANEDAILQRKLSELDAGLKAYRGAMGDAWQRTVVVVVTEFGRTARINGTGGTDHGTGGAMFLAGGALAGGRVAGQWPGIGAGQLYEKRDVHATTDMRAVFKGVLAAHLRASEAALESSIFPDSAKQRPLEGLLARA